MKLTRAQISKLEKEPANKYEVTQIIKNLLQFREEVVSNYDLIATQINSQIESHAEEEKNTLNKVNDLNASMEANKKIVNVLLENVKKQDLSQKKRNSSIESSINSLESKYVDVDKKIKILASNYDVMQGELHSQMGDCIEKTALLIKQVGKLIIDVKADNTQIDTLYSIIKEEVVERKKRINSLLNTVTNQRNELNVLTKKNEEFNFIIKKTIRFQEETIRNNRKIKRKMIVLWIVLFLYLIPISLFALFLLFDFMEYMQY